MADARVLPMFPLGTVLFPYAVLPLHVFEPRYRVMTRRVMEGDGEFGVVLIERGSEVGGGDVRFDVGTLARIIQAAELPDGRFALATVGVRRIRAVRWLPDDPYPQAEILEVSEPAASEPDAGLRARVVAALDAFAALARQHDPGLPEPPELDDDPVRASFEAAAVAPIGPLDAQRVLEAGDASERLSLVLQLLHDRAGELRARLELE
jgi:ATP-dependent Lon protease